MRLISLLAVAMLLAAQQEVAIVPRAEQKIYITSGTSQFICSAPSSSEEEPITVTAISAANPASLTATAHGFDYQSGATVTMAIKIKGLTGAWAAANGVWVATPTSANAMTIPVNATGFGALTGDLEVTTKAVRTTDSRWKIQKLISDGSGNVIWSGWAVRARGLNETGLPGGANSYGFACSARTTYGYQ